VLFPCSHPPNTWSEKDSMKSRPLFLKYNFDQKETPEFRTRFSKFRPYETWPLCCDTLCPLSQIQKVDATWRILMPESDDRGFWAQKTNGLCKRCGDATKDNLDFARLWRFFLSFVLFFFVFLGLRRGRSFFVVPEPKCVG